MALPTVDNVVNPSRRGYDGRIGDLYVRFATSDSRSLDVTSAPKQQERFDTGSNAAEITQQYGLLYGRSDFGGGEGLKFNNRSDRTAEDDRRYYSSSNIDITDDGYLQLLEGVEELEANASAFQEMVLFDGEVYYTAGTTLRKTSDPEAASPTWADEDPHAAQSAGTVTGLAVIGDYIYAAIDGSGVHRKQAGGAWAHWSDFAAVRIWAAYDDLLGSDATGDLYVVLSGAGTGTALVTGPDDVTYNDVAEAGNYVLVARSDGPIYVLGFDGASLSLTTSTSVPGEEVTALTHFGRIVFLATRTQQASGDYSVKFWTSTINVEAGTLANLDLVKEWDSETGATTGDMAIVNRNSVYFGVPEVTDAQTRLWRYDIDDGGLHASYLSDTGAGRVNSVLSVEDRVWWSIDGEGPQRNLATFASTGYLITAATDHGSSFEKAWAGLLLTAASLPASTSISAAYTTSPEDMDDPDSAGWTTVATLTPAGSPAERLITAVTSQFLALRITLNTSVSSTSPTLSSFSLRSYPATGDKRLRLYVNCSDVVQRRGHRPIRVKGLGQEIFNYLEGLEDQSISLKLLREGKTYNGQIETLTFRANMVVDSGSTWNVAEIIFRGRLVEAVETEVSLEEILLMAEDISHTITYTPSESVALSEQVTTNVIQCAVPSETLYPSESLYLC